TGNPIVGYVDQVSLFNSTGPVVTKLNGSSGAKVWEVVSPQAFAFTGFAMVVDPSGNVLMGGQASGQASPRMGVTKLNGATGATLWSKPVSRTANGIAD